MRAGRHGVNLHRLPEIGQPFAIPSDRAQGHAAADQRVEEAGTDGQGQVIVGQRLVVLELLDQPLAALVAGLPEPVAQFDRPAHVGNGFVQVPQVSLGDRATEPGRRQSVGPLDGFVEIAPGRGVYFRPPLEVGPSQKDLRRSGRLLGRHVQRFEGFVLFPGDQVLGQGVVDQCLLAARKAAPLEPVRVSGLPLVKQFQG